MEIGTTSEERTKDPFPKCPLFRGSTVTMKISSEANAPIL